MYWLYRFCAFALFYTHEAIGYPLFSLLAWLAYVRGGRPRQIVSRNMRHVLGPGADERCVQRVVREAYCNLAWGYYELFHIPAFAKEDFRRRMSIEGLDYIDEALAGGKGVLLVTLHFGNTEVLLQAPLLFPQWEFMVPVERTHDERIFRLVRRLRESQGMRVAPVDELLRIVRHLKRNHVVGIAADRDVTGSGVSVSFFGAQARLPDGAVRLAMRTGAALLPGYGWRERNGRFQIRIMPPIQMQRSGNADDDVLVNMRTLVAAFEQIVGAHPGQWMAFSPLWEVDAPSMAAIN